MSVCVVGGGVVDIDENVRDTCTCMYLRMHVGRRGERLLHRLRRKRVIDDASSRPRGWGKDLLGA